MTEPVQLDVPSDSVRALHEIIGRATLDRMGIGSDQPLQDVEALVRAVAAPVVADELRRVLQLMNTSSARMQPEHLAEILVDRAAELHPEANGL